MRLNFHARVRALEECLKAKGRYRAPQFHDCNNVRLHLFMKLVKSGTGTDAEFAPRLGFPPLGQKILPISFGYIPLLAIARLQLGAWFGVWPP